MYLFGSVARDKAGDGSDIDLFIDPDLARRFGFTGPNGQIVRRPAHVGEIEIVAAQRLDRAGAVVDRKPDRDGRIKPRTPLVFGSTEMVERIARARSATR